MSDFTLGFASRMEKIAVMGVNHVTPTANDVKNTAKPSGGFMNPVVDFGNKSNQTIQADKNFLSQKPLQSIDSLKGASDFKYQQNANRGTYSDWQQAQQNAGTKPINPAISSQSYERPRNDSIVSAFNENPITKNLTPAEREMILNRADQQNGGYYGASSNNPWYSEAAHWLTNGGVSKTKQNILNAAKDLKILKDVNDTGSLFQKGQAAIDLGTDLAFGDDNKRLLASTTTDANKNITDTANKITAQGDNYGSDLKFGVGAGLGGLGLLAMALMGNSGGGQQAAMQPGLPENMRDLNNQDPYSVRAFNYNNYDE